MTLLTETYKEMLTEDEDYITHANGGRPFSIHKGDNFLYIFKHTLQTYDNVLNILTGDKEDENSSVIIELGAKGKKHTDELYFKTLKHKYLFVGTEIYSFETDEPITKYYSLIGNSNVPYPVGVSKDYAYFMLDKVYIDKSEFPKDINWKDAYGYFYGHKGDKEEDDYKKHKMEHLKNIEKNPLRETIKNMLNNDDNMTNLQNLYEEVLNETND